MISPATVRTTTCRNVKPNRMTSFFSTLAGIRARIGASLSRRTIGDQSFPRGRAGRGGGTGGDEAERDGRPARDGGATRRGRAGTAGPGRAGTVPPRVPAAERPGAENTGVTGAGGRLGAVCGRGAAENATGGTGPLAGRRGVARVGTVLNTAGAG